MNSTENNNEKKKETVRVHVMHGNLQAKIKYTRKREVGPM